MRLIIQHETRYSYDIAPTSAIEVLRLTPCNSDTQSVRDWRIVVSGDAPLLRFDDAFGNITHTFTSGFEDGGLTIQATGLVETTSTSGVISGTRERLPRGVYLRETELTEPTVAVRELAAEAKAASTGTRLDFAHTLNSMINERMTFEGGLTNTGTTAGQALNNGIGVCQDLTHILLAGARAEGLPSRYISGYQFSEGRARDTHAGHAWGELYIDDLGWVGFDPTAGASSNETYVRVAVGLDYLGASPVRGAVYGGSGEELEVNVTMDEKGGWAPPSRQSQSQSNGQAQSQSTSHSE